MSLSRTSGMLSIFTISAWRKVMIGRGVLAGAKMPFHEVAS